MSNGIHFQESLTIDYGIDSNYDGIGDGTRFINSSSGIWYNSACNTIEALKEESSWWFPNQFSESKYDKKLFSEGHAYSRILTFSIDDSLLYAKLLDGQVFKNALIGALKKMLSTYTGEAPLGKEFSDEAIEYMTKNYRMIDYEELDIHGAVLFINDQLGLTKDQIDKGLGEWIIDCFLSQTVVYKFIKNGFDWALIPFQFIEDKLLVSKIKENAENSKGLCISLFYDATSKKHVYSHTIYTWIPTNGFSSPTGQKGYIDYNIAEFWTEAVKVLYGEYQKHKYS